MKKFGLLVVGGIAAMVLFSMIGPMVGLAVSLLVLYFVFKKFLKTESTMKKIGWAVVGLITLTIAVENFPAILGLVAAYILYVVYKKWNKADTVVVKESDDPFENFEKQWNELKQY
ncbi:flagellar basal body rod protein [Bacillus sp. CGMCC 1.16607]|uniref:lmo0954 family membrane protein n=1 Tax=Bacillus sp. CGMCC 1.16607 TaxID=3351842 RepID=UPI0036313C9A